MATKLAIGRNSGASAPAGGLVVVTDFSWPVEISADNDLVHIGELPAFHKLDSQGCALIAKANGAGKLAAQNVTVYVPDTAAEAQAAANTLVAATAITADTALFTPAAAHLAAEALGAKPYNRPVFLKLGTAPATAEGELIVRLASFPA